MGKGHAVSVHLTSDTVTQTLYPFIFWLTRNYRQEFIESNTEYSKSFSSKISTLLYQKQIWIQQTSISTSGVSYHTQTKSNKNIDHVNFKAWNFSPIPQYMEGTSQSFSFQGKNIDPRIIMAKPIRELEEESSGKSQLYLSEGTNAYTKIDSQYL